MSKWLLWLVLSTLQHYSAQIIKVNVTTDTTPETKCISQVIETIVNSKFAIWYSNVSNDLILNLLKKVKIPVILNAVENSKKRGLEKRFPSEVVIIVNDFEIDRILKETLWNKETRFFVVSKKAEQVKSIFENFWRYKVVNAFAIVFASENADVYSFLPYAKENCGKIEVMIVDKFISRNGTFLANGVAFKDLIRIKNLNGCRVNITVVDVKPNVIFGNECECNVSTHVTGIEGNLINEVAKKLNFNATFVISLDGIGWGWIRPSPHGAVGEVYTGRSDFAIGLLAPTIERFETLDISLPYNGEECITYGVPTGAGASTPNWITILVFEFSFVTWILIFFVFIVIITFYRFMSRFAQIEWFSSEIDIILHTFSSCLGLPVRVPEYLPIKVSLTYWIVFSFIITVAYKSSMGSKLTVPNRDPDINTFEELLNSKLELTGYNNMLRLLQYNDSELVIKKMVDRFKVTNFDIDSAVDRIAAERKIAYVRHTTTFLYYALINPKAKGHIHVIKDCIMLYHPMVVTKKHSPFSYRLNQLISRLMEGGITKRWRSEYIYSIPPQTKPFVKLSNDHMYGVFCILCFGYLLGLLVFFGELATSYLIKTKRPLKTSKQ